MKLQTASNADTITTALFFLSLSFLYNKVNARNEFIATSNACGW